MGIFEVDVYAALELLLPLKNKVGGLQRAPVRREV
jgi:hypothetical protein